MANHCKLPLVNLDNEANIQAEFYHHAKLAGLNVVLEMTTPMGRLDVAVLNAGGNGLVAVVECKPSRLCFAGGNTPQIARYKKLGAPVYGLANGESAERLVKTIAEKHGQERGVSLAEISAMSRHYNASKRRNPMAWLKRNMDPDLNIRGLG